MRGDTRTAHCRRNKRWSTWWRKILYTSPTRYWSCQWYEQHFNNTSKTHKKSRHTPWEKLHAPTSNHFPEHIESPTDRLSITLLHSTCIRRRRHLLKYPHSTHAPPKWVESRAEHDPDAHFTQITLHREISQQILALPAYRLFVRRQLPLRLVQLAVNKSTFAFSCLWASGDVRDDCLRCPLEFERPCVRVDTEHNLKMIHALIKNSEIMPKNMGVPAAESLQAYFAGKVLGYHACAHNWHRIIKKITISLSHYLAKLSTVTTSNG